MNGITTTLQKQIIVWLLHESNKTYSHGHCQGLYPTGEAELLEPFLVAPGNIV